MEGGSVMSAMLSVSLHRFPVPGVITCTEMWCISPWGDLISWQPDAGYIADWWKDKSLTVPPYLLPGGHLHLGGTVVKSGRNGFHGSTNREALSPKLRPQPQTSSCFPLLRLVWCCRCMKCHNFRSAPPPEPALAAHCLRTGSVWQTQQALVFPVCGVMGCAGFTGGHFPVRCDMSCGKLYFTPLTGHCFVSLFLWWWRGVQCSTTCTSKVKKYLRKYPCIGGHMKVVKLLFHIQMVCVCACVSDVFFYVLNVITQKHSSHDTRHISYSLILWCSEHSGWCLHFYFWVANV